MENEVLMRTDDGVLIFWCEGCREHHGVWTAAPNPVTKALWTWNGDLVNPTFSPSVDVRAIPPAQPRCHSVITGGTIHYCGDSGHALAGQSRRLQTVEWERETGIRQANHGEPQ